MEEKVFRWLWVSSSELGLLVSSYDLFVFNFLIHSFCGFLLVFFVSFYPNQHIPLCLKNMSHPNTMCTGEYPCVWWYVDQIAYDTLDIYSSKKSFSLLLMSVFFQVKSSHSVSRTWCILSKIAFDCKIQGLLQFSLRFIFHTTLEIFS